jgi:sugar lactone lactonase YvrE
MLEVEVAVEAGDLLGEGPVWDAAEGVRRPTSCAFGGDALDVLSVTTARGPDPDPGGSLLAARPPVPGLARPPFAG